MMTTQASRTSNEEGKERSLPPNDSKTESTIRRNYRKWTKSSRSSQEEEEPKNIHWTTNEIGNVDQES
jgi:hypothetical protein